MARRRQSCRLAFAAEWEAVLRDVQPGAYTTASAVFEHILPTGALRLSPYGVMRDPTKLGEAAGRALGLDGHSADGVARKRLPARLTRADGREQLYGLAHVSERPAATRLVEHPLELGRARRRMATSQTLSPTPERGYSATKDQLLKRLKRVEGQLRGVQSMVDEDRYCIDVLTQISAVKPRSTRSPSASCTTTRATASSMAAPTSRTLAPRS